VPVLGSSHAAFGLDPDAFGRVAYNLGIPAQSVYYDTRLLELYAGRMPSLEAGVFDLSYHTIEFRLSASVERWRQYRYYQVFGIPLESPSPYDPKQYSAMLVKGREALLSGAGNAGRPVSDTGWIEYRTTRSAETQRDPLGRGVRASAPTECRPPVARCRVPPTGHF
jgi:hypothetical protein